MKLKDYIGKVTWTLADKAMFVIFGLVSIVWIKYISAAEYGYLGLWTNIHTWIFVVSDAIALQSIVQFGIDKKNTRRANTFALIIHICVAILIPVTLSLFRYPLSELFNLPKLASMFLILPLFCLASVPRLYCMKLIYRDIEMNKLFWVNFTLFVPMIFMTFYYIIYAGGLSFDKMTIMYFVGHISSSLTAMILTWKKLQFGFKGDLKLTQLFKFSFPLLTTNLLHSIPKQLDVYLIKLFFDENVLGVYNSAKSLFRVFEETLSAAQGLVYPSIVRKLNNCDQLGLKDIMNKSVSFLLLGFFICFGLVEMGAARIFIESFLRPEYSAAIGYLKLLSVAALGLPLFMYNSLLVAHGKTALLSLYVAVSAVAFCIILYCVGYFGLSNYIPVAYIGYSFILGGLGMNYYRKNFGFTLRDVFRSVYDIINFVKNKKVQSCK
jgi:O-antigen/teichoic acid export membrane protein